MKTLFQKEWFIIGVTVIITGFVGTAIGTHFREKNHFTLTVRSSNCVNEQFNCKEIVIVDDDSWMTGAHQFKIHKMKSLNVLATQGHGNYTWVPPSLSIYGPWEITTVRADECGINMQFSDDRKENLVGFGELYSDTNFGPMQHFKAIPLEQGVAYQLIDSVHRENTDCIFYISQYGRILFAVN